jgi:sodium pump decarboxylase gamma subunit
MENLGLALKISGIGIVVLLLVLTVFAGLISLLTKFLKDKPEEEQEAGEEEELEAEAEPSSEESDLERLAVMAVAIARAQSAFFTVSQTTGSAFNSWGQFHLNRRLNTSVTSRRTK